MKFGEQINIAKARHTVHLDQKAHSLRLAAEDVMEPTSRRDLGFRAIRAQRQVVERVLQLAAALVPSLSAPAGDPLAPP